MSRLVLRKLGLLIVLVPVLHFFGAWYAYNHTGYFYPPKLVITVFENGYSEGYEYDTQPFMTRYRETLVAMAQGDLGRINEDRTKV